MINSFSQDFCNLLLVVPHFNVFIKDQAAEIRPYIGNITAVMPSPSFSQLAMRLPIVNRNFRFLKYTTESHNDLTDIKLLPSPYFTLPIEFMRKRYCCIAAKSCIKTVAKNKSNFNLVHAHFMENGFVGVALKEAYHTPLVVTAHGGDVYNLPFKNKWYETITKYVLGKADQIITVSRSNKEILLSLGAPPKKLHIIPNGYREKLFFAIPLSEARIRLCLPLSKKILLSVGNLIDVKGYTYLIDAMRIVLKKRADVVLIIVGLGILEESMRKKIKQLNLEKSVFIVGRKTHDEIPLWMNGADIFVLPSLREGFPTVIPEAMACGKPVVASRVGGIPDIVSTNEVGLLVDPGNSLSLAEGILTALDKKWCAQSIIEHVEKYSWTAIVRQILKVYEMTFCL
jgi:glycosyltransferase involved in cell wall biosynthesis